MYVQLGAAPENDFHNPLGLMSDCHRRIETFLSALLRVVQEADNEPLSPYYQHGLKAALTYFREAAPLHTLDEEDSLFPRLRQTRSGQRVLLCVERLEDEHQKADLWHTEVEELGMQWLQEGSLLSEQRARLNRRLEQLHDLYDHHIKVEDEKLFPLAAKVLTPEQLVEIGQEMKQRRGLH